MPNILNLAQHAIDSTPELELMPAGSEVQARIITCRRAEDKNGTPYLGPYFDVPDELNVAEFSDYIPLPEDSAPEGENQKRKRKLQAFGEAFDIDWSGDVDLDGLGGSLGYVILGVKKSDEYGDQNNVRKYLGGK